MEKIEEWCRNIGGDFHATEAGVRCEWEVGVFGIEEWIEYDGTHLQGKVERWNNDIVKFRAHAPEIEHVEGKRLDVYGTSGARELRLKPER